MTNQSELRHHIKEVAQLLGVTVDEEVIEVAMSNPGFLELLNAPKRYLEDLQSRFIKIGWRIREKYRDISTQDLSTFLADYRILLEFGRENESRVKLVLAESSEGENSSGYFVNYDIGRKLNDRWQISRIIYDGDEQGLKDLVYAPEFLEGKVGVAAIPTLTSEGRQILCATVINMSGKDGELVNRMLRDLPPAAAIK